MQTVVSYNKKEIRQHGSDQELKGGYNLWIDLVDPTPAELQKVQREFHLDEKALQEYENGSKKPQVRVLESHTFTVLLDMNFSDSRTLITEGVYLFLGRDWLVSIHSSKVDLVSAGRKLLEEKNKQIMESSIDALYYSILSNIIDKYEQLLTSIELGITDIERKSIYGPTRKMLLYLDDVSRQIIILRRHFWHIRNAINFLIHIQAESADIKYLRIVYDDINHLIELVESYHDTVSSTRELYLANVSLQMNETVRTLTLFSAILLPLTFIASIYGMNGLDLNSIGNLPAGFPIVLGTMAAVAAGLLVFFKRKRWLLAGEEDAAAGQNGQRKK